MDRQPVGSRRAPLAQAGGAKMEDVNPLEYREGLLSLPQSQLHWGSTLETELLQAGARTG